MPIIFLHNVTGFMVCFLGLAPALFERMVLVFHEHPSLCAFFLTQRNSTGGFESRTRRHHQKGGAVRVGRELLDGATYFHHPRRVLRRRELRHVRTIVQATLPLHLADRTL